MKKILLVVFVCGLVAASAPSLRADVFGQYFDQAYVGQQLGNGPFTLGWSFSVTSATKVTDLAVYHVNGVALLEDHEVGIWDATGNLLINATVTPTDPCVLDQGGFQEWCHVLVNGPVLLPGQTYTIGATWNSLLDPMIFENTVGNFNGPGVLYGQNAYIAGGFADPTSTTGDIHTYFGPNFSTVPEPGTLIMLGTGVLGLAGALRRKINV